MASLIEKLLRTGDKKTLRQLRNYADSINALEDSFKTFTDAELREETDRLRTRHADGEMLDDLLPEAFAADSDRLARFTREAQTLAALNHPNIVTIHDFGREGGTRRPYSDGCFAGARNRDVVEPSPNCPFALKPQSHIRRCITEAQVLR